MAEPERHREPVDASDQEAGSNAPRDQWGTQADHVLHPWNETPGDDVLDVENEATLNETPWLRAGRPSAADTTH
jgi:hypothetical protein